MSNSELRQITATAFPSSAELVLRDQSLAPIERGIGRIKTSVPAGLYVLQTQIGARSVEKLLRVADADINIKRDELRLEIPSPTPTHGTSTLNETHEEAAQYLSQNPWRSVDPCLGRLLLMVRDIRGVKGRAVRPEDVDGVTLTDFNGDTILDVAQAVRQVREDSQQQPLETKGWIAFSADLEPGTFVVRWPQPDSPSESTPRFIEQPIVIPSPGSTAMGDETPWTVCIFIHRDPATKRLLHESTRVHLTPLPTGFHGWNDESIQINLALESALTAVERGEPTAVVDLSRDDMQVLLRDKFSNPMLGIVGAHALLLRPQVNWSTFETVVNNLRRLVPGHPDVEALRAIGYSRRSADAGRSDIVIETPPMLAASYRSIVDQEWAERGLIRPGSLAEKVAGRLINCGPWTMWTAASASPVDDLIELNLTGSRGHSARGGTARGGEPPVGIDAAVIARASRWLEGVRRWAESEGSDDLELRPEHLGHALGLPPVTAERVFDLLSQP